MKQLFKELPNGTIVEFSEEDYALRNLPRIRPTGTAVRQARDNLLSAVVDPMASNILRWNAMTVETQQLWAAYRQALLDIPSQAGFPTDVTWPTKP